MSALEAMPGVTGIVTPVREGHRFDEASLTRWLADRLPGVDRGLRIQQFEGGQSNPTYLLETDAGRWVLRKKPNGPLLASAHMVEREARVLKALHGSGILVPEVPIVCEDAAILGTPFFVMTYAHGRILRDPALPGMTAAERTGTYAAAIDTLAALHAVDWNARGLAGYGKPSGYVGRQIARWSQQYVASKVGESRAMDWLMTWLPKNLPPEVSAAIVHGDYRLDNLVLAPSEPAILAVLDWELSTLGDPFTDVAHFLLPHYVPAGGQGIRGLLGCDLSDLGVPTAADVIARYSERRRLAPPPPARLRFYAAFSLFRMAAIAAGIDRRRHQGNASSAQARDVGAQVAMFAEAARGVAEGG